MVLNWPTRRMTVLTCYSVLVHFVGHKLLFITTDRPSYGFGAAFNNNMGKNGPKQKWLTLQSSIIR